ncbi:MAG: hypothetical protein AAGK32_09035 [Actinomycetota bacterium]
MVANEPDAPAGPVTITRAQRRFLDWTSDILVYTVVLNLVVEYVDTVVIDSFTISLFTAVLLKVLLDVILAFEHRLRGFFADREGALFTVLSVLSTWAVLFLSKFLILEVVDFVFGDHVELGKLVEVILLSLALLLSRAAVGEIFKRLGEVGPRDQLPPALDH